MSPPVGVAVFRVKTAGDAAPAVEAAKGALVARALRSSLALPATTEHLRLQLAIAQLAVTLEWPALRAELADVWDLFVATPTPNRNYHKRKRQIVFFSFEMCKRAYSLTILALAVD